MSEGWSQGALGKPAFSQQSLHHRRCRGGATQEPVLGVNPMLSAACSRSDPLEQPPRDLCVVSQGKGLASRFPR